MSKELVATGYNAVLPAREELKTMWDIAQTFTRSNCKPSSIRSPQDAFIVLQCGAELGLKPMQSFRYINVIQGKPSVAPEFMLSRIMAVKGVKISWPEMTNEKVTMKASRPGS